MKSLEFVTRQRGFTTGCVLMTLILFTLTGFIGLRLGGPYMEYRILTGAMEDVSRHDDFQTTNNGRIVGRIKQAVIRNSGINPSTLNLNKIIYIVVRDDRKVVGVNYEVVVELFYNISALIHFKHETSPKTGA